MARRSGDEHTRFRSLGGVMATGLPLLQDSGVVPGACRQESGSAAALSCGGRGTGPLGVWRGFRKSRSVAAGRCRGLVNVMA